GVNYEKSTAYHRFVLELFSTVAILCQKNSIPLSGDFLRRLEKMVEFVQAYTRPDGSVPLIGDADDGRLFRFSMAQDINDHRHALSIGAILFGRHDFKGTAGSFAQDSLWLFGGEGFERHQLLRGEPEILPSRAFPDGGFYIMRGKNAHVTIDAGELGMLGRGGHGHNDTFSFEFWANGEPLIVDSGTYVYTADPKARQEFRSTRSHNTVLIDNEEIAPFANLWTVVEDLTNPQVLAWKTSDTEDILEAEHYGYRRLSVVHRRRFEFRKNEAALTVIDTLTGSGEHQAESFLHFGPHVALEIRDGSLAVARNASGTYTIRASNGTLTILDTQFSRSYGIVEPNKTLRLAAKAQLPLVLKFEIRYDGPPQS
ncbi:MAG: alginate lyase family protein, partial [Bacteroidota bacterium]